ncbi:hypothetical protein ACVWY0_001697 [Arthrobacter sp. UYNi723]
MFLLGLTHCSGPSAPLASGFRLRRECPAGRGSVLDHPLAPRGMEALLLAIGPPIPGGAPSGSRGAGGSSGWLGPGKTLGSRAKGDSPGSCWAGVPRGTGSRSDMYCQSPAWSWYQCRHGVRLRSGPVRSISSSGGPRGSSSLRRRGPFTGGHPGPHTASKSPHSTSPASRPSWPGSSVQLCQPGGILGGLEHLRPRQSHGAACTHRSVRAGPTSENTPSFATPLRFPLLESIHYYDSKYS